MVKTKGLCIRCLGTRHLLKDCSSAMTCRECGSPHHSAMHGVSLFPRAGGKGEAPASSIAAASVLSGVYRLIVPVCAVYKGVSLRTYALLDSGATGSAISSQLVQQLDMNVRQEMMTVATYDYKSTALRRLVDFSIEPIDGSFCIDMKNTLVGEILTTESDKPPSQIDIENNPLFEGTVYFHELDNTHVGVVISARHAWTWETGERLASGRNRPIAVKTAFWVVIDWSLY